MMGTPGRGYPGDQQNMMGPQTQQQVVTLTDSEDEITTPTSLKPEDVLKTIDKYNAEGKGWFEWSQEFNVTTKLHGARNDKTKARYAFQRFGNKAKSFVRAMDKKDRQSWKKIDEAFKEAEKKLHGSGISLLLSEK